MDTGSDPHHLTKGIMDHPRTTSVVPSRAPRLLAGLLLAVAMVLAGPHADARKEPDTEASKVGCRASSSVKLKVESQGNGGLQVTAVVWSDDSDTWDWKMKHDDDVSAKGTVTAKDADKSFKIVRSMADFSGSDYIEFRAQNNVTGEVCKNELVY